MAAKPRKSADILDAVALLVVDMQPTFLDVIDGAASVTERCGFAIEAARTLNLRVVFTEQVPAKLGPTDARLRALVPQARVFSKNTFSALQAEGLLEYLRRQGVYHLMLAGIEIPVCIYQTALHAIDSDFDVTVLSDCVTARRADDAIVTLEALTRAHCHVLPSETVYYSMLGSAAHPHFPAYNALVKRYAQPGGLDAAPPPPPARERAPERRPALAAPEDQAESKRAEDAAGDETAESAADEPYIGRTADGAPADAAAVKAAAEFAGDEIDDDSDESPDTRAEHGEAEADEGEEDRRPEGGGRRRRGRRRRGGARRRRARERASAQAGGDDDAATGANDVTAHPTDGDEARETETEAADAPAESGPDEGDRKAGAGGPSESHRESADELRPSE